MPERLSLLSALEWEVMEIVWRLGGAPAVRDVLQSGYPAEEKAYTTIQTVMNTLVKKGFLRKKKVGLVNFYQPLVQRDDVVGKETHSFVQRVFRGSAGALISHIVANDALSAEELELLRSLIDQMERRSDD